MEPKEISQLEWIGSAKQLLGQAVSSDVRRLKSCQDLGKRASSIDVPMLAKMASQLSLLGCGMA